MRRVIQLDILTSEEGSHCSSDCPQVAICEPDEFDDEVSFPVEQWFCRPFDGEPLEHDGDGWVRHANCLISERMLLGGKS